MRALRSRDPAPVKGWLDDVDGEKDGDDGEKGGGGDNEEDGDSKTVMVTKKEVVIGHRDNPWLVQRDPDLHSVAKLLKADPAKTKCTRSKFSLMESS